MLRSAALLFLFSALCAPRLGAQSAEARLRAEVADLWQTDSSRVVLDLGEIPPSVLGKDSKLHGSGRGGWFVLLGRDAKGRSRSFRVRAGIRREVPLAARDVTGNSILSAADIVMRDTLLWGEPLPHTEAPTGWRSRRLLRQGTVLADPAITPPPLISSGESVRLQVVRGGVRVFVEATAVQDASRGERVLVRLASSSRQVSARVIGPSLVEAHRLPLRSPN